MSNSIQAQQEEQLQYQKQMRSSLSTLERNNTMPNSAANSDSNSNVTNGSTIGASLTYNSSLYGLSLQYPSDWSYQEYEAFPDSIAFHVASFYPPAEEDPSLSTELKITIENLNSPLALDQYTRDSINFYSNTTRNFSLISATTEDISLSEWPAYEILFTEYLNDTEIKTYEKGTIDNNKVYYLTFASPVSTYDQIFPVAETMIGSFELGSSRDSNGFDEEGLFAIDPRW